MPPAENGRIKSLDGLRGIAILLILFYHLINFGVLDGVFDWGWSGVDLFFVLSGFLITGILLDTKNEKGYFRNFLLRRALRILPLYYAVVLVFAIVAPFSQATDWFSQHQVYYWVNMSNILILQEGFFKPLGHFWSLATEEQFYLLWPLAVYYVRPRSIVVLSVFLLLVAITCRAVFNDNLVVYGLPLARFDGLLIGSMLAVFYRTHKAFLYQYANAIFIACTALLAGSLVVLHFMGLDRLLHLPLPVTLVCIFFGALLLMSLKSEWLANLLSNKVLLFFGKYSYAMYIFNSIFYHYSNWAGADRLSGNERLAVYSGLFVLTVIVSYLSFHLFEVRFLRLKKYVGGGRAVLD